MSVLSRKAVREELGQVLAARLTTATVYPDQPTSFDGRVTGSGGGISGQRA
jgi:hypothetical protein